ncbi:hypothetical protein PR003_g31390 [Phytophthora rubi]|uniref:Reverse transcriptase Ty1/copia-type domain-containing protein n=1 Tax=Phytophthora rubi TaxID=129364 RepID=A0A6A3GT66_9STRA|nr:hypothetical protein PR002_g30299 [Phytophthora rubi]KAE8960375.1 hypothetical protein PR001_g30405 [Phytophthora rubi]KAE9268603.1 hypothetical protein PR003_g31390 [Phytophthora rubi]
MYKRGNGSDLTVVGGCVDDLGTSVANVGKFFKDMKVLDVKYLGHVSKFLGTGIVYDELHGDMLNQREAILEMLERFGLADANAVRMPVVDEKVKGDDSDLLPGGANGSPSRPTIQLFQLLVGSILWIARCTKPDIVFTVHRVTRIAHAPRESD